MKKVFLILMLGMFTFGSSGFNSIDSNKLDSSENLVQQYFEPSCFDLARIVLIRRDGQINLSNIDEVRSVEFLCEHYGIA
jgi:hypothetical protein